MDTSEGIGRGRTYPSTVLVHRCGSGWVSMLAALPRESKQAIMARPRGLTLRAEARPGLERWA